MRCFLLQDLSFTRTPGRDRTASGFHAQTSTMLGHSAGINPVGLCGPHDLDVCLLCPHGSDLPKPVRVVPERALDPVVRYARVYPRGVRATSLSACIICGPGAHTTTEGLLRLRLVFCNVRCLLPYVWPEVIPPGCGDTPRPGQDARAVALRAVGARAPSVAVARVHPRAVEVLRPSAIPALAGTWCRCPAPARPVREAHTGGAST